MTLTLASLEPTTEAGAAITVQAGNRPPVVNGVIVSTNEDSTIVIAPLVNTTDPDGDALTVLSIGSSTLGALKSLGNNTYRFTPMPNLSASGTIAFIVSDGINVVSGSISLTVQAVADAPQLSLVGGSSVSREVLRTGFESAANTDQYSTNVIQSTFEGWTLITTPDAQAGGTNGFEIWTTGDQQQNAAGTFATVSAKTGNGANFLELNNAAGTNAQTLGISRSVNTIAGAQYALSFDYAGRPGFTTDFTKVGVFVDGVRVGTAANTSPSTSLNWQSLSYTFTGNGANQVVSFVSEATAFNAGGRGAMLDNIALTESIPRNQGLEDTAILLSGIASALVDTDGSETLAVSIADIPVGAILTDGTRTFTAGTGSTTALLTGWTWTNLSIKPPLNFAGSFTLKVRAVSTESSNAASATTELPIVVQVTPVNDAPVVPATVSVAGIEDQPYVFAWGDFAVSDVDSTSLSVSIDTLPINGKLQSRTATASGSIWSDLSAGAVFTQAQVQAGDLRFLPLLNESGSNADAATSTGTNVGNRKQDYASFTYRASDGQIYSATGKVVIDIVAVADAPNLTVSNGAALVSDLFRTGFEAAPNTDIYSTNILQTSYEGWTLITTPDAQAGGTNGFEIWTTGDQQQNAGGSFATVSAKVGNGVNFLELNNAAGTNAQTLGISRRVNTIAGAQYTLSFDYAGRPGFTTDYTKIGVFIDGVKLGTAANTSPSNSLNWQTLTYTFVGTGSPQTVRFVSEATLFNAGGRGAMLDNIALTQSRMYNSTAIGGTATLQVIAASLKDIDGSESLSIELRGLIAGSVLSDGTRTFTATAAATTATITNWSLDRLTLTPPSTYLGTMALVVAAISSEPTSSGTNLTATTTANLAITVHSATVVSPIVIDLNGDGIRTISIDASTAVFDLLNTGTAIRSGWLSPQDGFLAWDRNGNGRIDSRAELFGGSVGEGFAQLRELDSNLDGWLDASDPLYAKLVIWQDANSNKQTDAGELTSLAQRGINRIDLAYTNQTEWQNGNLLIEASTATTTQGTKLSVRDAYFAFEAAPAPLQPKVPAASASTSTPINASTMIYYTVDTGIALPPILATPPLLKDDELTWPPKPVDPRQSNAPVVNWDVLNKTPATAPSAGTAGQGVNNMRRTVPVGGDVFDDSAAQTQTSTDYRDQSSASQIGSNANQGMVEAKVELKAWFKKLLNKIR